MRYGYSISTGNYDAQHALGPIGNTPLQVLFKTPQQLRKGYDYCTAGVSSPNHGAFFVVVKHPG